ncbi:MAG: MFS transporter [Bacteroidota bacterium]
MAGRYWMVVGTFLLALLLYIDRVCISVAKEPIASSLGLSDEQMGWVLSVFALGYALFQTPAGILADRLGSRRVLATVVSFWSLFTALTGAAWNFVSLLIVRLLFGAGEAGAFPGISRAVFSWIPLQERGLVTGINFSGSRLGAAFALPFVAWLITTLGWRVSFFVLGGVGVIWAVVWYLTFRDDPTNHAGISTTEQDFIRANRQQIDPAVAQAPLKAGSLIGSKNMWLAMGQYFCSNFTFFFCLTWLFPHLKEKYALETLEAGFYASAPLVLGAFGNWFGGWWIDRIYRQGNWTLSRRLPAAVGFGLAAVGLVVSVYMETPLTAIIFLSIAIFGADMTLSPSWSFAVDIGRQHAGAVSGTMNMAGNIGAFITALAFPYMQSWTGSEVPFFFVGAGLNVIAIILWLFMQPEKQLEEY